MIAKLIAASVRFRWAVVVLIALVCAVGAWQLSRLPIDAVPDITNKQVQINTVDPGLSPIDMEKRVTFPLETALAGIPGLGSTRSVSRNGFSQVTAVFAENTDLYFARQQVSERIAQAQDGLPTGARPQIGPVTTGLGEVFMYTVDFANPGSVYVTPEGERLDDAVARGAYLRTVQDWIIAPQLRGVPGVAGVDSIGGFEKQYLVEPDPVKLSAYGLSYSQLAQALETTNLSVGANFFERGGEAYLVRADARIRSVDDIAQAVIATRGGVGVMVRDVATVRVGGDLRTGAASRNGHEVVVGTALMRIGQNSRTVAKAVGEKLATVQRTLPAGIVATPTLDRSKLVNATVATVQRNLFEGAVLVAVTLFFLLGNVRAALIAVLVIPVSFLMTAIGMNSLGVSGNLMSLGALDFGLIVDGAVIVIENGLRRLALRQYSEGRLLSLDERLQETALAARETIRPTVYGQGVIFLVFAPLLTFTGVEGKTFTPMALTLMLALAAAFVLSLTFVPAMLALLIRGRVSETDVRAVRVVKARYAPLLRRAVATPAPFISAAVGVFLLSGVAFAFLGQEFIPKLDEKNLALASSRIASTSLEQSLRMQRQVETAIMSLPEVATMFSKTGTAEVATDPMPPNISDGFIILKDRSDWPKGVRTKADVIARVEAKANALIGNGYELSQPIELRFNELIGGVRGDVAIKIYGDDMDQLGAAGAKVAAALRSTRGGTDVKVEQVAGAPTLDVAFDRAAIGRLGLSVEAVADTVATAMAGHEAGQVFEGDRGFDVVVRAPDATRADLDALGALPVILPAPALGAAASVPLSAVARFRYTEGLNQVSRENGKRLIIVQANVRGRDIGSFVRAARPSVEAIVLPAGAFIEWSGQFENLQAATARLAVVVPLAFLAIFALLYLALGGVAPALAVFLVMPLGLAGGVFALVLTGIPFSISAAVGFIVLGGVAVLNGLVVMSAVRQRLDDGWALAEAIIDAMTEKVRAVLITGLAPAVGFIPMALSGGAGAEVQKPLAVVVIGGLLLSTVLTLTVLPAMAQALLSSIGRSSNPS